jgi:hypothetical protein
MRLFDPNERRAGRGAIPRPRSIGISRWIRMITAVVLLPLTGVAVMSVASTASAAGVVSPTLDRASGFPVYYQDSAGNRVVPCTDANDPNCVLPTPGPGFDPAQPLSVPANYPDEFFYAYAQSDNIATQGCNGTAPGRALVVLALEGAFVNGAPAAGDQMTFGRIRVKVTSGLCPNTTYQFKEPFGTETFTTNDAGAVPANAGTQDVGCTPAVNVPCDFTKADASRLMGSAGNGFLRWDNTAPAAPAGYLGDGATLHPITGGTNGNTFSILDSNGNQLTDANGAPLSTPDFTVSGKLAALNASPSTVDFGGQNIGTTSAAKTVTITNWDSTGATLGAPTITGGAASAYRISSNSCVGTLARDTTCTIGVTFSPTAAGRVTDSLVLPSTGGFASSLTVPLTGSGTQPGAAANIGLNPNSLAFGNVRIRTVSTPQDITVSNPVNSTAPLSVTSAKIAGGNGADQFRISSDTCTTGTTIDPGGSCVISVTMVPSVTATNTTTLTITSNAVNPTATVAITGTGTGGVAAVSNTRNPDNGFPTWYMDENGVKVQQCLDPNDANCTVLPDEFFNPAQPLKFPTNFPSEFFYQDADSDKIVTPGCNGGPTGSALFRSSIEGAFVNAGPVDGEQMTFGRIRIVVRGGLCPNSTYTFVHPYGTIDITTNATGGIAPNRGTEDVGCAPIAPDVCDFTFALSSRVFGGLLRWDPTVAPAAPAGYLGDAVTLHKVIGSPYSLNGAPVNSFSIKDSAGTTVASTDLFTVMGKLLGPLEASPTTAAFDVTPVGSTSGAQTVTYTNTGIAPITVSSLALSGTDAADFTIASTTCTNATLAVGGTCAATLTFSPSATGVRSASLVARHSGLNDPFAVPVSGVGGASNGNAAISFVPRSLTFAPLHTGGSSKIQTIQVSNAGGTSPLDVNSVVLGGTNPAAFTLVSQDCTSANGVPVGQSCNVRVAFTPNTGGSKTATVVVTDNAPGGTHSVGIAGTASDANPAVSPNVSSSNGFPQYYQDSTGTRLEPCLNAADTNCIVLPDAGFDPNQPLSFPSNFPTEWFYSVADSNTISTPGCGGTAPGTALLRVALEGSFVNGTPVAGDQMTFTRLRISVTSGLCPNTPYNFVTPYGVVPFTTNDVGGVPRNQGTTDIGCAPVAPALCTFSDALGPRTPLAQGQIGTDTAVNSFLREDPAVGNPPAGYLGDAKTFAKVVGGTYKPVGASEPVNYAAIVDTAGNEVTRTDTFTVSGKIAGPLQSDTDSLDFGKVPAGTSSATKTVKLTNVLAGTSITSVAASGVNAGDFVVNGNTCATAANMALDATCTVQVTFRPTATGAKTATLRIVPATGSAVLIPLTGFGDTPQAPTIQVTPGVLAYGTVTAPASASLTTTIKNTGNAPLNLLGNTISGAAAADYTVSATTCPASLAVGASCTITVQFKPTAVGSRAASLTIKHNAGAGSTVVSLTGTGAGSQFTMSPNPVTFGTVNRNTTKAQTISVKNSGTISFTVGAVSFAGADAAAFSNGGGCSGTVLLPGKSCNLTVNFRPTLAKAYTASVVLAGDATSLPATVSASLSGTGK